MFMLVPRSKFHARTFVGIAWNSGDAFTYRIWTCPEGKQLSEGHELVRNIVKSRDDAIDMPKLSALELDFIPGKRSGKRKRSKVSPEIVDNKPTTMIQCVDRQVTFAPDMATLIPEAATMVAHAMNSEEPGGKDQQVGNHNNFSQSETSENYLTETLESIIGTEMTNEINDELDENRAEMTSIGGSNVTRIDKHRWHSGQLQFRVHWNTGQPSWEEYRLMKVNHPYMLTAEKNKVSRSAREGKGRTLQWAKKSVRDVHWAPL